MEAFIVDKITNSIEDALTGTSYETDVFRISASDLKNINKLNRWKFNWKKELQHKEREVYKLVVRDTKIIQGLLSMEKDKGFIKMHLIESAPHNFGSSKQYAGVSGNLVAFACKESFEAGFDGYVGFEAKTKLIQHYIDSLGAEIIKKERMQITTKSAEKLVNSYFKNHRYGRKK